MATGKTRTLPLGAIAALWLIVALLPSSAVCFTDREVFELLLQKSEEAKQFPFHVRITWDYMGFKGNPLPVSSYEFFQPFYDELKYKQPGEIYATYQFSQGTRWKCFLLRVPNMYDSDAIDLWTFDKERGTWQRPIKIAEWWGDAGYVRNVEAWIDDLNKDGFLGIIRRTVEEDTDFEKPESHTTHEQKDTIFVWDKDRFKETMDRSMLKINPKTYIK